MFFIRVFAPLLIFTLAACQSSVQQNAEPPSEPVRSEPAPSAAVDESLLPNARTPIEGVVSGGQPSYGQLQQAKGKGYKTVINMRTAGEPTDFGDERKAVEDLGMAYIHIPVAGGAGVTVENAKALADALATAEKPLLLHCGSGNRIGALLAMKAFHIDGKSAEEAMQIGLNGGLTGLAPLVKEKLTK